MNQKSHDPKVTSCFAIEKPAQYNFINHFNICHDMSLTARGSTRGITIVWHKRSVTVWRDSVRLDLHSEHNHIIIGTMS